VDLTLDDQRIDHASAVLDESIAPDRDLSRGRIDLDDRDVDRAREGRAGKVEVHRRLETGGEAIGKSAERRRIRDLRDLGQGDRATGEARTNARPPASSTSWAAASSRVRGESPQLVADPVGGDGRAPSIATVPRLANVPLPRGDSAVSTRCRRMSSSASPRRLGHDLSDRGRVPLALCGKAHGAPDRRVRIHRDGRGFDAGDLHRSATTEARGSHPRVFGVARDPDTDESARGARRLLLVPQLLVLDRGQGLVQRLGKIAAVVGVALADVNG